MAKGKSRSCALGCSRCRRTRRSGPCTTRCSGIASACGGRTSTATRRRGSASTSPRRGSRCRPRTCSSPRRRSRPSASSWRRVPTCCRTTTPSSSPTAWPSSTTCCRAGLILGIGAGGLPTDWEMFGIDGANNENRFMAAEALEIMIRLWEADRALRVQGQVLERELRPRGPVRGALAVAQAVATAPSADRDRRWAVVAVPDARDGRGAGLLPDDVRARLPRREGRLGVGRAGRRTGGPPGRPQPVAGRARRVRGRDRRGGPSLERREPHGPHAEPVLPEAAHRLRRPPRAQARSRRGRRRRDPRLPGPHDLAGRLARHGGRAPRRAVRGLRRLRDGPAVRLRLLRGPRAVAPSMELMATEVMPRLARLGVPEAVPV